MTTLRARCSTCYKERALLRAENECYPHPRFFSASARTKFFSFFFVKKAAPLACCTSQVFRQQKKHLGRRESPRSAERCRRFRVVVIGSPRDRHFPLPHVPLLFQLKLYLVFLLFCLFVLACGSLFALPHDTFNGSLQSPSIRSDGCPSICKCPWPP